MIIVSALRVTSPPPTPTYPPSLNPCGEHLLQ